MSTRPPARPAGRNPALAAAMAEIRRGSATTPVPSGRRYRRKDKHPKAHREEA